MHAQAIQSLGAPSADPPLIRIRHALVVCVVCGRHQTRNAGRERISCPDYGSSAWRRPAAPEAQR